MGASENSKFILKLEVSLPDKKGGPPKKFAVNRNLKAKWSSNSDDVMKLIFNELAMYSGSFVGDMATALIQMIKETEAESEEKMLDVRENDLLKWSSAVFQYLIYSSIKDGLHEEFIENPEISEWDGSSRSVDAITKEEINSIDIDRLAILLAPHLKHALYLISKKAKDDTTTDGNP
jgi:hypothetical protein